VCVRTWLLWEKASEGSGEFTAEAYDIRICAREGGTETAPLKSSRGVAEQRDRSSSADSVRHFETGVLLFPAGRPNHYDEREHAAAESVRRRASVVPPRMLGPSHVAIRASAGP